MLTTESLEAAYEALAAATRAMHTATMEEVIDQESLNWSRWRLVAEGKITGKNEAEREANIRIELEDSYEMVFDAADVTRSCRLALDLAQQRVDCLKLELRLRELEARTAGMSIP
jgi:hypothetical protein